jgi:hypothetical protein
MLSKIPVWLILFTPLLTGASTDDTAAAERLLDRITQQEEQFAQDLRERTAIVETYIQETPNPDGEAAAVVRDHYFLAKLTFTKGLEYTPMVASAESPKGLRIFSLFKKGGSVFVPSGFAQMVLIDADGFNRSNYTMEYIQREFVGEVRCLVFDVTPVDKKAQGKFIGRIWVEDRDYRVVRFNGTYTNSSPSHGYVHFDSWRVNVAQSLWVPAYVYAEESQPTEKGHVPRFKAQTRLWGYNIAKTGKLDELTSIAVESEKAVTDSAAAPETSPLERQRLWERQAEKNILEKLEKSGLLAPPGPVDEVLNTVVNNLIVTNNLEVEAKCRVLLTTPLETFSVGQTIVISRGLVDVLPDEASLAMVLSAELAHIALGQRTDTHFAFYDQTMLSEGELLGRLQLARSEEQVESATDKAMEMLTKSPYGPKLANAGLFLKALSSRAPQLPSLIRANLGNQLASGNSVIMRELADRAPALEQDKLEQIAALPLGSRVRLDPWNDEISLLKGKPVPLLSARDKLPFEVTPFLIFLSRAGAPPRDQNPAAGSGAPVQPNAGNSTKEQ